MVNDAPLLFRPELIEEESLLNYIYRLSIANKYPSLSYISDLLNIKLPIVYSNSIPESALEELSKLTLHSKESLYEKSTQVFESHFGDMANNLIRKSTVKCCPLCLDEDLKHKALWNLNFINMCPTHNVLLIDTCENCNKRLNFSSLIYFECIECGFDLRKSNLTILHSGSDIYLSQQIVLGLINKKNVSFVWDINLKDYLELSLRSLSLLAGLPSFIDLENENPSVQSLTSTKNGVLSNKNYALSFANVYWMYQNFPQNFFTVLDAFYQKHYLKRKYPRRMFEELINIGSFQIVKDAYDTFWKMKVSEGNVHHNFIKSKEVLHKVKSKNLSKYEVMNRFGFSIDEVRLIWKRKELLVEVKRGGKKQFLLSNDSIEKLEYELGNWEFMINKKEAITKLGIAVKMFNSLVDSGYIEVKTFPWHKNDFIDKRELTKFINKYVNDSTIVHFGISLHDAIRKYQKRGLKIEVVLKLIESKKLTPFLDKSNGTFGDILFHKEELAECLQYSFIDGKIMYSLTNLEKKLKMEKPTLHKMIHNGILIPEKTLFSSGGNKRYLFSIEEMEEFIQKHISVPDAALAFNISRDSLYRLIKRGKIKNVLEGVSKIHLLRKDDLIKALSKKRGNKGM